MAADVEAAGGAPKPNDSVGAADVAAGALVVGAAAVVGGAAVVVVAPNEKPVAT